MRSRFQQKKRRLSKKGGKPDNTLYEITYKLAPSMEMEKDITERMNTFNTVTKFLKNISRDNSEAKPHNLSIKWYYTWNEKGYWTYNDETYDDEWKWVSPRTLDHVSVPALQGIYDNDSPGLQITFDVKFNQPKTQKEVKTWFDKYFDYVEGTFESIPIAVAAPSTAVASSQAEAAIASTPPLTLPAIASTPPLTLPPLLAKAPSTSSSSKQTSSIKMKQTLSRLKNEQKGDL
jgi:hypothetical protein